MASALVAAELSTGWHVGTQRRRIAWLAALALVLSIVFAGLVLLLGFVSAVLLLAWFALAGILWQPRVGLYVALGMVALFETGGQDELMMPGRYFHYGLQATLGLSGVIVSPLEMLLITALVVWLARGIMSRGLDFRSGRLGWPMLLFSLMLVFGLIRGRLDGGDPYIGFWEVRSLLYFPVCYVLAANTIRTRQHVATLMAIFLVMTSLYSVEGAYRKVTLIDTGKIIGDLAYGHEMVIFVGTALLIVLAQQVVGTAAWQRMLGLLTAPIMIFTLLVSERRAGYIAVAFAFLAFALVFLISNRKAFFLLAVPILIGGAVYLPLFWNNTTMFGQPARAVRSLHEPDPRDAASNLYRDLEKINVRETIQANPLLGVGFGKQFYFVVPLPDLSFWEFWRYEPHHNILWVWLKTGALGFIAFWVLMGSAVARAAQVARDGREPVTKTFGFLALAGIVMTLVFCYVDLGLTMGRVTVFLGTVMGTLAIVDEVHDSTIPLAAGE